MTLRFGIIGYGKMGRIRHEALSRRTDAIVSKVYDPIAGACTTAPQAASEWEILEDPEIDAVCICTPNARNANLTIAALERGKHVLCEKPPAFSAQGVRAIIAQEKRSDRTLMYGFNHRHHPSFLRTLEVIQSGELGNVLWMRGRYGKSAGEQFFGSWRADPLMAGGGILLDQGIHLLDLMLEVAGGFDEVQSMVSNAFWRIDGIEDNAFLNLRNRKTQISASLHSTMTQWRHLFSFEIFLERGHVVINGLKTSSNSYGDEILTIERNGKMPPEVQWEEVEQVKYTNDTSWDCELTHFIACIGAKMRPIHGNSGHALRVMEIIDEVYAQNPGARQSTLAGAGR